MANTSEGFERRSPGDFRNFLGIALGSCAEVRSHLYVALDQGYIDEPAFKAAFEQAETCSRLIFGFMRRLSESLTD